MVADAVDLSLVEVLNDVLCADEMFIIIGLFGPLGNFAAALPKPVLGGITVVMFGMIPVGAPQFWDGFPPLLQPVLSTGIAAGGIAAFVLNLILNVWGAKKLETTELDTVATDEGTAEQELPSTSDDR